MARKHCEKRRKSWSPVLLQEKGLCLVLQSSFPKLQILDSSKVKQFADNNSEFDRNGGGFSERVENAVGKEEICLFQAIFPFPTEFSKDLYCRHCKTRACLGKG